MSVPWKGVQTPLLGTSLPCTMLKVSSYHILCAYPYIVPSLQSAVPGVTLTHSELTLERLVQITTRHFHVAILFLHFSRETRKDPTFLLHPHPQNKPPHLVNAHFLHYREDEVINISYSLSNNKITTLL